MVTDFSGSQLSAARLRALEHVLLGVVPLVLTVGLLVAAIRSHWIAQDFSLAYYPAAQRLLAGGNPYAIAYGQIASGSAFVYPALSAVLLAPAALLTVGVADHLYTLLCLALVPGTLWALGVKDWRVYGVTLLWFPIVVGWQGENMSVPLMFMVALAWRYRDRPAVAGLVVAAAISMKPFVWPLGLWLIASRRFRAATWMLGWALVLNLIAWALVGFAQIATYVNLAGEDAQALLKGGYGILAAAHHLGLGFKAGEALLLLACLVISAAILVEAYRGGRRRGAFILAVALMLAASPLVWIHYFVLLLIPLALARPRFSAAWLLPVGLWILPSGTSVDIWQLALAWALIGGCFAAAFWPRPVGRRSADRRP